MNRPAERTVGGVRCSEVLAMLSEFVDGELAAGQRQRVVEHLRGCDWCEKFGERFSTVIAALREELAEAPVLQADVAARLRASLEKAWKE